MQEINVFEGIAIFLSLIPFFTMFGSCLYHLILKDKSSCYDK